MVVGRLSFGVVALALAAACVDKSAPQCDPSDDTCNVGGPGGNPCRRDSDCGDGKCGSDGKCVAGQTSTTSTACANVTCKSNEFCSNGLCLPSGPQCKPADSSCIFIPHGAFEPPTHQWWWPWQTPAGPDDKTGHDQYIAGLEYPDYVEVMSTPVVIRLHANDASPAVVFNTFTPNSQAFVVETQGVMRAVNGKDGSPIWTAPKDFPNNQQYSVDGNAQIAAGDCTGSGEVCFITGGWDPKDENRANPNLSHQHGGLIAFGNDGRVLWVNRDAQVWWGGPTIARLLGTPGPAQVVVGNGVYDGATGRTLCSQSTTPLDQVGGNGDGTISVVADVDLDGVPEIITGNQAYKLTVDAASPTGYTCKAIFGDGVKMPAGKACAGGYNSACPDGFPAIANLAGYGDLMGLKKDDPHPQIIVASHGTLRIQDWTGGILLAPIPLPTDPSCGDANEGGAPTIADFDGDGLPEIGIAGQGAYVVWKPGVKTNNGFIWMSKTRDCSSNTGSSVFDFEGKGQANVVYSDQCYFRVYDGKTGNVLVQEQNSSCTAYEMPIVADIDGTGRARVLVPNNNVCQYECPDWPNNVTRQDLTRLVGLKALQSPSDKWVNTRSVWNEHGYHMTNVNLDGTLPYPEPNSWAPGTSNSYRQNVQGRGAFSSPDLSICQVKVDMTACQSAGKATVTATVYNAGALVVRSGVAVTYYAMLANGQQAFLGQSATTRALKPGDAEDVSITWTSPPQTQAVTVKAIVDEKQLIGSCHPENNNATSGTVRCTPLG